MEVDPSVCPPYYPTTSDEVMGYDTDRLVVSGPALQSAIASMTEMGFERDQVMRAMKASFNNPERAVEYLMSVSSVVMHIIAGLTADTL